MQSAAHSFRQAIASVATPIALSDIPYSATLIAEKQTQVQLMTRALISSQQEGKPLPRILTLDQWLTEQHLLSESDDLVITRFTCFALIRQIIGEQNPGLNDDLAWHYSQTLMSMIDNHNIPHQASEGDPINFISCYRSFQTDLLENHATTITHLHDSPPPIAEPTPLVFFGFALSSPTLETIWNGTPKDRLFYLNHTHKPTCCYTTLNDPRSLKNDLLHWCKNHLPTTQPQTLAIITPAKHDDATLSSRINHVLTPQTACHHYNSVQAPSTSFTSCSLADIPILEACIQLLHYLQQPSIDSFVQLIQNTYWQESEPELDFYPYLTRKLQKTYHTNPLSSDWMDFLEHLIQHLPETSKHHHLHLWSQWHRFLLTTQKKQPYHAWPQLLTTLFEDISWPFFSLSRLESQALERFFTSLRFTPLGQDPNKNTLFSHFCQPLILYLRYHSLLDYDPSAPLVIAQWQDILDIPLDGIYFYCMDSAQWPDPHFSAEHDVPLDFWKTIQTDLQQQSPLFYQAISCLDSQNQICLPPAIVASTLWKTGENHKDILPYIQTPTPMTPSPVNDFAPPASPQELGISSSVLRLYNQCSCQGFLRSRLNLNPEEEEERELPPWLIGQITHTVLEENLTLPNLTPPCPTTLRQSIQEITGRKTYKQSIPPSLGLSLQQHVFSICLAWLKNHHHLHIDDRVLGCDHEVASEINLGGVQIRLRADRIDKMVDGSLRIIDYKTGKMSRSGWFGERLAEPQLPLYALAFPDVQAISYASLHPDQSSYIGIAAQLDHPEGVQPPSKRLPYPEDGSWGKLLNHWRQSLTDSAKDYASGLVRKNPILGTNTCSQCGLHTVCRLYETSHEDNA